MDSRKRPLEAIAARRLDVALAHGWSGYPWSGCLRAEPDSVSPDRHTILDSTVVFQLPLDTGVMPPKSKEPGG